MGILTKFRYPRAHACNAGGGGGGGGGGSQIDIDAGNTAARLGFGYPGQIALGKRVPGGAPANQGDPASDVSGPGHGMTESQLDRWDPAKDPTGSIVRSQVPAVKPVVEPASGQGRDRPPEDIKPPKVPTKAESPPKPKGPTYRVLPNPWATSLLGNSSLAPNILTSGLGIGQTAAPTKSKSLLGV